MQMAHSSGTDKKSRKRNCSYCELDKTKDVEVSIPGLARLVDPSYGKKGKLVWLLIVLCCAGACIYLTVDRLVRYCGVPLTSKVLVKRMNAVTFPAFTICSSNLLYGLKPLAKLKVQEECIARHRSDCELESELENISFRDLNFSLDDLWQAHSLIDIEVLVVGMDETIKAKEYLLDNITSDDFEFTSQDTILGSCVVIRHIGLVPYLSAITSLTVTIYEPEIKSNSKLAYTLILHGEPDEHLTGFEFLTNEFELIPAGSKFKVKLHEENFRLKDIGHAKCYEIKEETDRIKNCATDLLRLAELCRLPSCPECNLQCESLKDIPEFEERTLNTHLAALKTICHSRPVCIDSQYVISIDTARGEKDPKKTSIVIRMTDDTVDIVEEFIAYNFPDLVSDLFAYWSFFLNLSALVFAEIFEYLFETLGECIKRCRAK